MAFKDIILEIVYHKKKKTDISRKNNIAKIVEENKMSQKITKEATKKNKKSSLMYTPIISEISRISTPEILMLTIISVPLVLTSMFMGTKTVISELLKSFGGEPVKNLLSKFSSEESDEASKIKLRFGNNIKDFLYSTDVFLMDITTKELVNIDPMMIQNYKEVSDTINFVSPLTSGGVYSWTQGKTLYEKDDFSKLIEDTDKLEYKLTQLGVLSTKTGVETADKYDPEFTGNSQLIDLSTIEDVISEASATIDSFGNIKNSVMLVLTAITTGITALLKNIADGIDMATSKYALLDMGVGDFYNDESKNAKKNAEKNLYENIKIKIKDYDTAIYWIKHPTEVRTRAIKSGESDGQAEARRAAEDEVYKIRTINGVAIEPTIYANMPGSATFIPTNTPGTTFLSGYSFNGTPLYGYATEGVKVFNGTSGVNNMINNEYSAALERSTRFYYDSGSNQYKYNGDAVGYTPTGTLGPSYNPGYAPQTVSNGNYVSGGTSVPSGNGK